ncbi:MAG TPA: hypothetical protein VED85_03065, partial [Burkholderiaceae bacterium]|nr:hypothetical protein [Burkholderiaceae bacterium]
MPKPSSRVVVINDDPLILRELLKGLNAAARALANPFGISFVGAPTPAEGLRLIREDGDTQLVIVDDKLAAATEPAQRRTRRHGASAAGARNLAQRISALRPEIEIYVLIEKAKADQVVDTLFAEAVHGYFYREEHD